MLRNRQTNIVFHFTVRLMLTARQYTFPLQPGRQSPTVCFGLSEPKDPIVKMVCFLDL